MGINTPISTMMGPMVIPNKPKPKGSLSNVMMKNPMTIMIIPVIKI